MPSSLQIAPLRYQPSFEQPETDEAETIAALNDTMAKIRETVFQDSGHAMRSVHAKSHGILFGNVEIMPDLPPVLAQGLFAAPGVYDAVMRLSTAPGDILDDSISTTRGLALKINNVPGERLPGSENSNEQDFVLADGGPVFLTPTAKKFLANLKPLAATTDKAAGLKKALAAALQGMERAVESIGRESPKLKNMGGHPKTNILGETFFSQAPILYGAYMAKICIAPVAATLAALKDTKVDMKDRPDALRETVREFFIRHGGEWELRVQLCTNIDTMPIEDPSVAWPEADNPYLAVARIAVAPQDSWDGEKQRLNDTLAFSPWNGLAAHRPLGSIMRARRDVYRRSAEFRLERNGCPVHGLIARRAG